MLKLPEWQAVMVAIYKRLYVAKDKSMNINSLLSSTDIKDYSYLHKIYTLLKKEGLVSARKGEGNTILPYLTKEGYLIGMRLYAVYVTMLQVKTIKAQKRKEG